MCCCGTKKLRKVLQEGLQGVAVEVHLLTQQLAYLRHTLSRPGRMRLRVTKEDDMLHFVISLPPTGDLDTTTRELTVTVGTTAPVTVNPALTDIESSEFSGNDTDAIHAELVDIDDVGNRSQPSVLDTILTDTMPPRQPGELGVRVTRED